jgi:hypothetical protein
MNKSKLVLIVALIAAVALFFAFDLGRFFTLDFIKQSQAQFGVLYAEKPLPSVGFDPRLLCLHDGRDTGFSCCALRLG